MPFLVMSQGGRLGEGNDRDGNVASVELCLCRSHLAEVILTGQSGQVPEKDN